MGRGTWGSRYAIAASSLALAIALGGTAYAVNTVRSADIVDGTIRTQDIGDGQVLTSDIRNNTVSTADASVASLGRSPRAFARFEADGTLDFGVLGFQDDAIHAGTGVYVVQTGRDVTNCVTLVNARGNGGYNIASDQASTSAINVYVNNAAGTAIDVAFDVLLVC